jgi:hypothetical protein
VHESHRSPYQSPSRSPWRSSKCPKEKSLRMTTRSIWARAKHRLGLERPHLCTRFRGQSDAWGRSSPQRNFLQCFARVHWRIPDETSEEGKKYALHFQIGNFFTLSSAYRIRSQRFARTASAKVAAQERSNRAGATPLFGGQSAQKFRGVTPALADAAHRCFLRGCMRRPENLSDRMSDILYEQERRIPLAILKAPPKQPKTVTVQARVEESVKTQLGSMRSSLMLRRLTSSPKP